MAGPAGGGGEPTRLIPARVPAVFEIATAPGTATFNKNEVGVSVTAPSRRPVTARVLDVAERPGVFRIEFTPEEVGTHLIDVSIAEDKLAAGPLVAKVYDASLIKVTDVGNAVVGQQSQFRVDASAAGEGQLEISINEGEVPNHVQVVGGGRCLVFWRPETPTPHRVDIKFNGEPVPSSPFVFHVAPAQRVTIDTSQVELIPVGEVASCSVRVEGSGGGELAVIVRGPRGEVPVRLTGDVVSGLVASFTPRNVGPHVLTAHYNNQPVPGTPFTCKAYDGKLVSVTGGSSARVGVPVQLAVDAAQAGEGNLEITVAARGLNIPTQVHPQGNARFNVSFTPTEACDHVVNVSFNKMRVPGCPLIIEVSEGSGIGARVTLPGPVPLHQPASLTLHHPTATLDQIEVNVEGPNGASVPAAVSSAGPAVFRAEFVPKAVGEHRLNVLVDSVPIPASPFHLKQSREKYLKQYDIFNMWRLAKGAKTFSENVLLAYFIELSETKKASTLWSTYSMLKLTIKMKKDVHIDTYHKLVAFLKRASSGYKPKKSKVFTASEIAKFINEAPDSVYLAAKVVLIIGITGACRINELTLLNVNNVSKYSHNSDELLLINVLNTKTKKDRNFVIRKEYVNIVQKYQALRPSNTPIERFFLQYRNGKCIRQPMGQNKIGSIPREIATFLGLLEPPLYTGHCFRRTSATLLAESGADLLSLKRHGGWKSNSVVEGYIEDSIQSKSKICNSIVEAITLKEPLSDSWSRPSTSKMSPHKIGNNSPLSPTFTPIESNESAQLFKITDTSSLPQNSAQFTNTNITLPNKNIKLNIMETMAAGPGNLEVTVNGGRVPTAAAAQGAHTYAISFTPRDPRPHTVELRFNGDHVPGSPFVCHVSAPARVIGAGSGESPDKVSVGDAYTFSVDSPTSPHVEVLGPARRPVPVQVSAEETIGENEASKRYTISFVPVDVGDHSIEDKNYHNCAFPVLKLSLYQMSSKSIQQFEREEVTDRHTIAFIILEWNMDTELLRKVRAGAMGGHVEGSPFLVKAYSAARVAVTDISPGVVGRPVSFTINASHAGAGNLEIIVAVNGRNVPNYVQSEGNARFKVNFKPVEAAPHTLSVRFNGHAVPGSPFTCPVTSPVAASEARATGPGLASTPRGEPADIQLNGFHSGEAAVYVTGPGGTNVRARINAIGDGQYTATFTPEAVGRHSVQVTCGGRPVPGSPFTCNVYDVRRVRVTGLGPGGRITAGLKLSFWHLKRYQHTRLVTKINTSLHVANSAPDFAPPPPPELEGTLEGLSLDDGDEERGVEVGKPVTFSVDAAGAGEGTLELVVSTPSTTVKAEVVAVARGLYDVTFVPVSREPHRVSVTFNEQPVPGSPFVCRVSEPHTYVQIGGVATVEVDENITDVEVISPTGTRVSEANLEDTGLLTFPATRVGRYLVKSSRGPVADVEALDASAVKVLSIGDAVAHRPAILTVSTSGAGNGRLSGRVTCGGAAVPHSVRRRGGARQELVWHPARAAPHRLTLLWSGAPVAREPMLLDALPPQHGQESLQRCQVDYRYVEVLSYLYENATISVRLQNQRSNPIQLQRGVRQRDEISPKLFTAALEDIFMLLDWKRRGININGEYLSHLRFADDVVLMAETLEDLNTMLEDLSRASHNEI
ncbi:unnamed protein product [Chilo suppressalis]|uniref:Tyr recombinase domain-containing protein n=1 Tax=Chilo suppressalis TaxID=168631 RepID=A0ABN8B8K8_CHISP|nr:unnamed protein product [Chilo suppressalis]